MNQLTLTFDLLFFAFDLLIFDDINSEKTHATAPKHSMTQKASLSFGNMNNVTSKTNMCIKVGDKPTAKPK